MNVVIQILSLLGSLGLFLYGMTLMSESLQKVAGNGLRRFLASMTSNPFKRILTGLCVTAIIQSSSATTVMVVSFVNAGLLTLTQSIGVIMGANIGTTVTAWFISLLGFKADISMISIPLIGLGFAFMMSKKSKRKTIGELIIGFALLFLGLSFMKDSVPDLNSSPEILAFLKSWTGWGFGSVLIFVGIGTLLTIVLQSSSATVALTLVMINFGWIPFEMAAAMVLGENIGTTITANIAASVGNTSAKRTALAHTVFNMFGVIWVLALFKPFLTLISKIVMGLGCANPFTPFCVTNQIDPALASMTMLYSISMLHTLFNVTNTLIMVWFVPTIVKIVKWIIPGSKDEEIFRLQYIQGGILSTAELSLDQSKREIVHFAQLMKKQYSYAHEAILLADNDKFNELFNKLEHYEQIADQVEYEIANYLNEIGEEELSHESGRRTQAMYKIIGELESIGDSGYNIGRILQRKNINNIHFDQNIVNKIIHMLYLVEVALDVMIVNCDRGYTKISNISNALDAEYDINEYRNNLREEHLLNLENNAYSYLVGVYYMDIISELERVGDFIINISEAIVEIND
ncbi:MAG: Na/Pi cotransporter family protein [Bacteroidales bacterium]|nr:Na/Pi cotransporter family protein [Bacteroidales bacterium]